MNGTADTGVAATVLPRAHGSPKPTSPRPQSSKLALGKHASGKESADGVWEMPGGPKERAALILKAAGLRLGGKDAGHKLGGPEQGTAFEALHVHLQDH